MPPQYSSWSTAIKLIAADNNRLTGTLPPQYSSWTQMGSFSAQDNSLQGDLPEVYSEWGAAIVLISLFSNRLTGQIPASWGIAMTRLVSLYLSLNELSGTLPSTGSFQSLKIFSISYNNVSGPLPSSFMWPLLSVLDAQNNSYLTGPIGSSIQQSELWAPTIHLRLIAVPCLRT